MEVLIGLVTERIPHLRFVLMSGWASLNLNIKSWLWVVIGLFLSFIGVVIMLCRPVKEKKVQHPLLKPVSSEEIFDQALQWEEPRRINAIEIQYSARA